MTGGDFPTQVIKDINLTNTNIHNYLIENEITDAHKDKYSFKFSKDNGQYLKNSDDKFADDEFGDVDVRHLPKYLGKGAMTAVYKIELVNQKSDNYKIPDKYKDQLILRIFDNDLFNGTIGNQYNVGEIDENRDDQTSFINMWMTQKQLFQENIIDFFMYGEIKLNDKYLGFYTITRTYLDNNIIEKFDIITKLKYFKNMLLFLQKLIDNNYTYRDLKFANVGAELINGEYKFIVLDYDKYTILNQAELEFIKKEFSLQFAVGTYTPYYIFEQGKNFSYDYMFVGGLIYTIMDLFYNDISINRNFTDLYLHYNNYIGDDDEPGINQLISEYIIAFDANNLIIMKKNIKLIISKEPLGRKLLTFIDAKKYEDIDSPINKLIFIIGKIMKGCISLNYEPVKKLINIPKFISALDDIIGLLDGSKPSVSGEFTGGYYKKYIKYKNKYINLKSKNI
jgi:hypothetical protein